MEEFLDRAACAAQDPTSPPDPTLFQTASIIITDLLFCSNNLELLLLRIQLKLNTALLSTVRPSVCPSVTGVTSHISHIYKGINAMLIIRGPIKPYIF